MLSAGIFQFNQILITHFLSSELLWDGHFCPSSKGRVNGNFVVAGKGKINFHTSALNPSSSAT
ncbi:hypothetical protein IJ00_17865 [Calothrix sp. 336/3]|nr:hypothetical protein IJ00_17865 [Calothrix sp. 336/3]